MAAEGVVVMVLVEVALVVIALVEVALVVMLLAGAVLAVMVSADPSEVSGGRVPLRSGEFLIAQAALASVIVVSADEIGISAVAGFATLIGAFSILVSMASETHITIPMITHITIHMTTRFTIPIRTTATESF
ncbi:MAG TPA: hypothetical protein VK673_06925 [Chthoniobacterales bacterium]|nr:hypothetical protein [Chthoniobacterales bacterium]